MARIAGYFREFWRRHVIDDFENHYPDEPWLF